MTASLAESRSKRRSSWPKGSRKCFFSEMGLVTAVLQSYPGQIAPAPYCSKRTETACRRNEMLRSYITRKGRPRNNSSTGFSWTRTSCCFLLPLLLQERRFTEQERQGVLKAFRSAGRRKLLIPKAALLALLESVTNGSSPKGFIFH